MHCSQLVGLRKTLNKYVTKYYEVSLPSATSFIICHHRSKHHGTYISFGRPFGRQKCRVFSIYHFQIPAVCLDSKPHQTVYTCANVC